MLAPFRPDKQKTLADVGAFVQSGTISLKELEDVYRFNVPTGAAPEMPAAPPKAPAKPGTALATALYVVGTLIVCIGIYLLIAQNWSQMTTPVRIAATLGLGLVLYGAAWYRVRKGNDANNDLLTACLFAIAATALTIGAGVIVTETHGDISSPGTMTGTALIMTGVFLAAYLILARSLIVLLFAIGLSIFTYYAGIETLTHLQERSELFYTVESIIAGALVVSGGILAHNRVLVSRLSSLLYELGTLLVLGSAFWLTLFSGFSDDNGRKLVYDVLYPFILAAGVWLSVYLKARSVLIITALFLTGYVFEISFEYFSNVLGGSVALVLAGVLVMGMAYGATRFAKRFITKP